MGSHYSFKFGEFKCTILEDSVLRTEIDKDFPNLRSEQLEHAAKLHEVPYPNVRVGFNYLLLEREKEKVLVDTGRSNGYLLESIEEAGYNPREITHLIITHGDGDHIGGINNFPNATIFLPRRCWELWTNQESREKLKEEFAKSLFIAKAPTERRLVALKGREKYGANTLPSLKDRLGLVEDEEEFLKGYKMIYSPGHRTDHYALMIESKGKFLLHMSDAIRYPFQAAFATWTSIYDSHPIEFTRTLKKLNKIALEKKALLFGTHIEFPGLMKYDENYVLKTLPLEL